MRADTRDLLSRYGLTALATCLAVGALIEDLASRTVTIGNRSYDRGPEALIVVVIAAAATLVALRGRLGVGAPLCALALFGVASFSPPAWLLDSPLFYLLVMLLCGLAGFLARSSLGHAGLLVVLATGSLAVWNYPDR